MTDSTACCSFISSTSSLYSCRVSVISACPDLCGRAHFSFPRLPPALCCDSRARPFPWAALKDTVPLDSLDSCSGAPSSHIARCTGPSTREPPPPSPSPRPTHSRNLCCTVLQQSLHTPAQLLRVQNDQVVSKLSVHSDRISAHKSCVLWFLDTNVPLLRHKAGFRLPSILSDFFFNYCRVEAAHGCATLSFQSSIHSPVPCPYCFSEVQFVFLEFTKLL